MTLTEFPESLKLLPSKNVFDEPLLPCCFAPATGFYRDGSCNTGIQDMGKHLVCAQMTSTFLAFSKKQGNDLSTPRPEYDFVGLTEGDWWCLCVLRWIEALEHNMAPLVRLESTHQEALKYVSLDILKQHAYVDNGKL